MSTLEERSNNLSPVNYQMLLESIAQRMKSLLATEQYLLSFYPRRCTFDIDRIAWDVAEQFASSKKYPFEYRDGITCSSTYLPSETDKRAFTDQLTKLTTTLETCIQQKWQESGVAQQHTTMAGYLKGLLNSLDALSRPYGGQGLQYPLTQGKTFEKQPLQLKARQTGKSPWLKGHKVTIQVEHIKTLLPQVIESVDSYLEQDGCTEDERTEAQAILKAMEKKQQSPLLRLEKIVCQESLARIQREARVDYLAYLYQQIKEWPGKKWEGEERGALLSLYTLIQRLKRLEAYIRDEDSDDGHYQVMFRHTIFNFRTLFARADAFDILPIISEIEGFLGETTDKLQGMKTFISGIKLKLNGRVYVHGATGQPVYEYYLPLLDPDGVVFRTRETQTKNKLSFYEKVLKVAMLYFFVFKNMSNHQFDPKDSFETEVLEKLQSGDEEEENAVLHALYGMLNTPEIKRSLNTLRDVLKKFLDRADIGTVPVSYSHVLSLKDTILVDSSSMLDRKRFFKSDFEEHRGRDVTRYLTLEEAAASPGAICKLPVIITFEPIYYYAAEQPAEQWIMKYETAGLHLLPVLLTPLDRTKEQAQAYVGELKGIGRIELGYRHHDDGDPNSEQAFVYRFTYLILVYLFLHLMTRQIPEVEPRSLFLSFLCIHMRQIAQEQAEQDTETFLHTLSKLLSHMFAQDYLSNSQGFHVDTFIPSSKVDASKHNAALFSLYSGLPRSFQLQAQAAPETAAGSSPQGPAPIASWHTLEKLAMIVVSSRQCDMNIHTPDEYLTTVYGEMIGLEQLNNRAIRVSTISTFSMNQDARLMYTRPEAILEQVKRCYAHGYRHFLYVARAPYSSSLHISDKEDLFFMNEEIIEVLRGIAKDIKVYPTYCDRYSVVNQERNSKARQKVDSLYIDDIGQLANLANDPSRRSLIFLNLFSGATVNPDSIYNGVMSYATLRNVYTDPTYDQDIWNGLLNTATPQSLRTDILNGIALLHFARYEKPRDLGFKLDPYKRVIGDTSVGKMSLMPHMRRKIQFNALAFLTLVRSVMRAQA